MLQVIHIVECEIGKKYTEFTLVSQCEPALAHILLSEITLFIYLEFLLLPRQYKLRKRRNLFHFLSNCISSI